MSILMLYYTHQIELEKNTVAILYSSESYGAFDYTALLKPNTTYNKTTLEPGEGPIFTRIVDEIDVEFTYAFQGSKPANLTVNYGADEYVETPTGQKKIGEVKEQAQNATGTNINLFISDIPAINVSSVQNLVKKIMEETGINIVKFNVTINVQVNIHIDAAEASINESFNPQLKMKFGSSYGTGEIITVEGLEHTESGQRTETNTIYQPWVNTQRNISYIMSVVSFPALLGALWAHQKIKPPKLKPSDALIEELIEPFKEIVSEAEEPQTQAHATRILMKTWEDLAKVADTLSKPIIHTRGTSKDHVFYVVDGTTRYECTLNESTLIEKKQKENAE